MELKNSIKNFKFNALIHVEMEKAHHIANAEQANKQICAFNKYLNKRVDLFKWQTNEQSEDAKNGFNFKKEEENRANNFKNFATLSNNLSNRDIQNNNKHLNYINKYRNKCIRNYKIPAKCSHKPDCEYAESERMHSIPFEKECTHVEGCLLGPRVIGKHEKCIPCSHVPDENISVIKNKLAREYNGKIDQRHVHNCKGGKNYIIFSNKFMKKDVVYRKVRKWNT